MPPTILYVTTSAFTRGCCATRLLPGLAPFFSCFSPRPPSCSSLPAVGIEIERDDRKVKGYHSRPFGCEVGAQFHHYPVSRSPPIMPDGRVSQVRFEALAVQL